MTSEPGDLEPGRAAPAHRYTVSDVMSHTAVAVGRGASYKEAVELMQQWKVGALPVLEGEGRVVGVVSEADLLLKEEFKQEDPHLPEQARAAVKAAAVLVEDLMSSPAVTVRAHATLPEAARVMAQKGVKQLPVVNGVGLLEGMVSRSDLLKVFLRSDQEIADDIHQVLDGLPLPGPVHVTVRDGIATLRGPLRDRTPLPLLARALRTVEGVVDVRLELAAERVPT
ncbi:CBS domain-containing protein [Streptomyces cavernicola]|uniref:CBS domain-containing protein n=1 Tax=Streptomyces cavernicola TaxID=3043613 RepID=A0ABT6SHF9_9ACTN|nr:CBS domain-containing protein [Streptomyces sp. B-S-A6]MDI3406853.1 CBS domain-containing protein [Streptomyces sp. B-S-A6]